MYDRENFMAFVGDKSGSSYASGLRRIEATYAANIEEEYRGDACAALLAKIEQDKRRSDMDKTALKQRSDWASHLKKYIEYKKAEAANRRDQFVAWMRVQPQRTDPTKQYSALTVEAAAAKLESGLKLLDVGAYKNTNCFDIADSRAFSALRSACYAAAEAFDKKQGHSDFRNGLDFYMQFLNEQADTRISPAEPMEEKVLKLLSAYKADFARIDADERYKWEAVGWYKRYWEMEAPDFAAMLETAFSKADNLLAASMYWPYKMAVEFARQEPETVRELFRMLYDERLPLAKRYKDFRAGFERYVKPLQKNHYQDLHAVSVYLSFEYPEVYYIYKYKVYTGIRDCIGYPEDKKKRVTEVWKIETYNEICDYLLSYVKNDSELMEMSRARLDGSCYRDEAFHLLTTDIAYFSSNLDAALVKTKDSPYWPPREEYDPGLTEEQWSSILKDETVTTEGNLTMLKMMLELGGESTCAHLAEVYGNVYSYYNKLGSSFGEKVKKKLNCPDCVDNGTVRYFPIPFVGKYVTENGNKRYLWKLRDELREALMKMDLSAISTNTEQDAATDVGLNTILYGPPGTGKTYHTVIYAVAIVENKELAAVQQENYSDVLERYNEYKSQGRIEFTTFHQSYGYEEFIEGIKPVIASDENGSGESGEIQYCVQPGVFKRFCERAQRPAVAAAADPGFGDNPSIWKVSLWGTGDNPIRTECLANDHIRIGWDEYGKDITEKTDFSKSGGKVVLNAFMNRMQIGDIVFSCYSASTIDAIGVVIGEYEWHDEYDELKRLRRVKWIVKGIQENIIAINGGTSMTLASVYRLSNVTMADVNQIIEKYQVPQIAPIENIAQNYVFIIDEINRGNISKIFGELITLLEPEKRIGQPECMKAVLPYSQKPFGVPRNVYIVGTMNTADRSIATLDTALRRRFFFQEMPPNPVLLADVYVEDLPIDELLTRMNQRITALYDREHAIGHAYFMSLAARPTIDALAEIFKKNIIPLLQEYFYEDYEKIRLVLGDNKKDNPKEQFITASENDYIALFGDADIGLDEGRSYEINDAAFDNIEAYRSI